MALLYIVGNKITAATSWDIEFKNIFPIISLVFWDSYLRLFISLLLKFEVVDRVLLVKDNKSSGIKATLNMSYNGNSTANLRFVKITVKGVKGVTIIKHRNIKYTSIGDFTFSFNKENNAEQITIEFDFIDDYAPNVNILGYQLFCYKMVIDYTLNNKKRTRRKSLMIIRKGG